MTGRPDSFMPLWIGDYLADTGRLTTEAHGAYLLLIMDYWRSAAPLPDDQQQLASITRLPLTRWKLLAPIMRRFFVVGEGLWRHKRIDQELAGADERYDAQCKRTAAATAARLAKMNATKAVTEDATSIVTTDVTSDVTTHVTESKSQSQSPKEEPLSSLRSEPSPTARGARLPDGWSLPEPWWQWAAIELGPRDKTVDIDREAEKFRDFWHAKPGAGGRKADWEATWRNWIRRAKEDAHGQRGRPHPPAQRGGVLGAFLEGGGDDPPDAGPDHDRSRLRHA